MIRIQTGSRLHFGLLSPAANENGVDRLYGGVGLMVEEPSLSLTITPSKEWSATGPLKERASVFANRFTQGLPGVKFSPQSIRVETAPPEHAGFGVGTQLGLAIGKALALAAQLHHLTTREIAMLVERGRRSSLGIHGFAQGGFLVEGGKKVPDSISPLLVREEFPSEWRIVLALPIDQPAAHGPEESHAFRHLQSRPAQVDHLSRLVLLGLLPALAERDLQGFGAALHEYNARAGEAFATIQGGRYAHPKIAEAVHFARGQGVRGVGQSSWGPAVFALVGDDEQAQSLAESFRRHFGWDEGKVIVTRARNRGAEVIVS